MGTLGGVFGIVKKSEEAELKHFNESDLLYSIFANQAGGEGLTL